MRLETSRLSKNPDLQDEDLSYHKVNRFYDDRWMTKPEFMFKNHQIELKPIEITLLEQALAQTEEEEAKRGALMSQQSVASKDKGGKPSKDAKDKGKPAGKGQTPAEDANIPKNIEIEWPEDMAEEPDYIIMEKNFMHMK